MFSISFQTMYSINCGSTYLDKHSLQNQSPCRIVSPSLLLFRLVGFVSVLPFSKTNFRNSIKYQFLQSPAFAPHCRPKEKMSSKSPAIGGTFAVKINRFPRQTPRPAPVGGGGFTLTGALYTNVKICAQSLHAYGEIR